MSRLLRSAFPFLALFVSCDVADPISSSDELAVMAGVALAGAIGVAYDSRLEWSADEAEIYFESNDGSLRAASTTQGGTRVLNAAEEHFDVTAAASSHAVYFAADRNGGYSSIYRTAGGSTTVLTSRAPATNPLGTVDGLLVLSGPDDVFAAYIVAPDSLFVYEVGSGDRHAVTDGCVRVVAFSPAGDHLICRRDGPRDGGFAIIDIATGASRPIAAVPADPGTTPRLVRWHEDAVRLLFSAQGRFRIRRIDDGSVVALWQPPIGSGPRSIDFVHYAWSDDGDAFAFWAHECIRISNQGYCDFGQSVLHVIDLEANVGRVGLVVKGSRGAEQVALSPDGRSVAYVFEGKVWIRALP